MDLLTAALTTLVIVAEVALAVLAGFLALLVVASLRPKTPVPAATRLRRFAVIVPAHDEEPVIGRLLASLRLLEYPANLFDVHVIADNCADRTAELARAAGVVVHERVDPALSGKGQAIRWLLERLPNGTYDAFAIYDADSVVSPGFLTAMNARLEAGALAVQGYYGVLNPGESWVAALRSVAFYVLHYTRRLGLAALGASVNLGGNGMVFAAELRDAREWSAFGLAEDLELGAKLATAGVRVAFAPEATVLAEMPATLRGSRTQNDRWERGRLSIARAYAPKLVVGAIRHRDAGRVFAALDLLTPPLSMQAILAAALVAASVALGSTLAIVLGGGVLAALAVYFFGGLLRAGAPPSLWLALPYAPVYVAWKGGLYVNALLRRAPNVWIRTERASEGRPRVID